MEFRLQPVYAVDHEYMVPGPDFRRGKTAENVTMRSVDLVPPPLGLSQPERMFGH